HFTSELDVSKNTVLTDLKHTQHVVEDYGLNIHYSRRSGYVIDGNEFEIRKLLFHVTDRILEMPNGFNQLCNVADIRDDEVAELDKRLKQVENKLNLQFTDEKAA